ncbi:deubiquitinase OTUD6B [Pieris napi]|uniref:deubiquitinase OTUD6B n=1 Tax=Pieris napi TaxID=78633 RepID=UPI001FB865BA|nr:deubiquitinase OTUD6B [Pieris napi]
MSNDNIDEYNLLTSIESRHRKERKELQSKIQGLKKAAKNDKTRKKELSAEIAKLEAELESRQTVELEELKRDDVNEASSLLEDENIWQNKDNNIKLSKAQKRRNKKNQEEQERAEQIKLQEKENRHGPRNLEMQAILARLKERHLNIFTVSSDGDCLYKAIEHQLTHKRNITVTVDELRKNVCNHIKENKDDFLPFLTNPNTFEMLTSEEFEDYCEKICSTKVWGGQLEIRALSNCLKCPITVIQATGPETIEQGNDYEGPPLIITYHRHMYSLGEHYNSTVTLVQDEIDNQ